MSVAIALERQPQQETANRLRVFGAERLAHDIGHEATPASVDELRTAIANAATGAGGMLWEGVYIRRTATPDNSPQLLWDPAHIMYGFLPPEAVRTDASITNLSYEERWLLRPAGRLLPGKYAISETLEITDAGSADIHREIVSLSGMRDTRMSASKPANAAEVAAALNLVNSLNGEKTLALPLYVEIAFGLDPAVLRGEVRNFDNKMHLGIDPAVGNYRNAHGQYADAVKTHAHLFAQRVNAERPGQNIAFVIGDGSRLPLRRSSVREVFMANLLNATAIANTTKNAILADVDRVLEPNGRLVVKVNWHQDAWPLEATKQLLAENGFSVRKVIDSRQSAHALLEAEYGTQQEIEAPEGYYLIAQRASMFRHLGFSGIGQRKNKV